MVYKNVLRQMHKVLMLGNLYLKEMGMSENGNLYNFNI